MLFLLKEMFRHFADMKMPFVISAVLFALGIWIGIESEAFRDFLQGQLNSLGSAAETFGSMEHGRFWTGAFIFVNNTVKTITVMYLGLLMGIIPVLFLLINGMVVGYLLSILDGQGLPVGELIVKGLLPHGILEIPAILVACGYGLKMGAAALSAAAGRPEGKAAFKKVMRVSLPLMLFLTVVLLIAAVIESTVTVWFLSM